MKRLIEDEKRMPKIGELLAIKMENIETPIIFDEYNFSYENDDEKKFYMDENTFRYGYGSSKTSKGDSRITIIKYLGNGIFLDLTSGLPIRMSMLNLSTEIVDYGDDYGVAFRAPYINDEIEKSKIEEIERISVRMNLPEKTEDFYYRGFDLYESPLRCNCELGLDSLYIADEEILKKYKNQDLLKLKSDILNINRQAKIELKKQLDEITTHLLSEVPSNIRMKL